MYNTVVFIVSLLYANKDIHLTKTIIISLPFILPAYHNNRYFKINSNIIPFKQNFQINGARHFHIYIYIYIYICIIYIYNYIYICIYIYIYISQDDKLIEKINLMKKLTYSEIELEKFKICK